MRLFKNNSLQTRIFVFTLVLVLIPVIIIGLATYSNYKNSAMDNLVYSNKSTVNQISENLTFILEDIHDLSLFVIQSNQAQNLLQNTEDRDRFAFQQKKREAEELLVHLIGSKDYIKSIHIGTEDALLINTNRSGELLNEDQHEKILDLNGQACFFIDRDQSSFVYSRVIKNLQDITSPIGYISIHLDMNYLDDLLTTSNENVKENYYLIHNDEKLVFKRERIDTPTQIDWHIEGTETVSKEVSIDRTNYLQTISPLEAHPFSVVHLISLDQLLQGRAIVPRLAIVSLIVSLVVCLIVAFYFSRYIVQPVKNLESLMKEVENDNLDVTFTEKGTDEINQLGSGFNAMLTRIKYLIERVYQVEIKNKDAELKALTAQINPHFLYNTLDTIYWMSFSEGSKKSAEMAYSLSQLFRMILKEEGSVTTVENELSYVTHYLKIQEVRYQGMINFDIDVEPGIENYKTVKMVIQPLIENAITHGIEHRGQGNISIQIKTTDHYLDIKVEDDGVGADITKLLALLDDNRFNQDMKGYALRNINDRIRLNNGVDCGLIFLTNKQQGLTVIARQKMEV
ncbi:two-component system, sensor histidine kinase YesM [Halolactibacillus halophilus]|uniref:Histidine kinase n=1 Tax=Halolactibacillus halophilus TaxID=306540 RepID=A0A1I5NNS2_9BACI|nr:histidine kinase [Halolactibacillus halophilus]GEM01400.1 histidine kinase [Halolactibacillus halophilus]SFP23327.1 two-component system, sensor histidine kinase YesM [Halolactibacillus halophilus]